MTKTAQRAVLRNPQKSRFNTEKNAFPGNFTNKNGFVLPCANIKNRAESTRKSPRFLFFSSFGSCAKRHISLGNKYLILLPLIKR